MLRSIVSRLSVLLFSFASTCLANQPPAVKLVWPDMNPGTWWSFYEVFGTTARCQDSDGSVEKVEFYFNGVLLNGPVKAQSGPDGQYFQLLTTDRPVAGKYTLIARAYDNNGATTDSLPLTVKVQPAAPPPSVT